MKAIQGSKNFPFAPAPKLDVDRELNQGPLMRGLVERCVVYNLLLHLERNGWKPYEAHDGEGFAEVETPLQVMELAFNLDECTVRFESEATSYCHWVKLVFGNDGTDCVSDWGFSHGDADGFNATMEGFDAEHGVKAMLQHTSVR